MDVRFWLDALSALLQIVAAYYMTYRYTQATHCALRTALSAALILIVYMLTDGILLVRATATCVLQLILVLIGAKIPKINAAIYTVLSIFMMFIAEFPLDLILLLAYPDFVSMQQLPIPFIVVFRLIATPYFIFCFYINWMICDKLFHRYTAKNVKRYFPLFVFHSAGADLYGRPRPCRSGCNHALCHLFQYHCRVYHRHGLYADAHL